MSQKLDLESLFIQHDLLLIDGYSLAKISFDNEYDLVLEPILKKLKKRIYLPYSIFEKLQGDPRIYKKYFGIQKYIVVSQEYNTINEAILANKNKKLLYTPSVIKLLSNYINKGIANILHNHMFIILYNLLYNLLRLNQKLQVK